MQQLRIPAESGPIKPPQDARKIPGFTHESGGFGKQPGSDVVVELELPGCRWRWL
jgi:hypothetical protein